jgi:hypothetical protein
MNALVGLGADTEVKDVNGARPVDLANCDPLAHGPLRMNGAGVR